MAKILIVEDDASVREPLTAFLKAQGFDVTAVKSLEPAREILKSGGVDLLILDWNLPDGDGPDLAKEISGGKNQLPIIMLTARNEVIDRVLALELGAQDYMSKPFDQRELLARIRVQLRKKSQSGPQSDVLRVGSVELDMTQWKASYQGKKIELTRKEFDLLKMLVENPNRVFTRDELLTQVWGMEDYMSTRTVDTHILNLRNKLSQDLFETVRGVGYRFKWNP